VTLTVAERAALAGGPKPPAASPPAELTSLEELTAALQAVQDREEVGRRILVFLAGRYGRAALFQAGRERVSAWMAGPGVDPAAFAGFTIGFDQPSLFLNLRQGSGIYVGPLPPMPSHRELARTWGGELPRHSLMLPVRIRERLVVIVYADSPRPGGALHLEELKRLTAAAADSLSRCILLKKQASTDV